MKLAVVGAGWAGLAAAVLATQRGHSVTLLDTAPQPGGRARSSDMRGRVLDNGQHILIGAYVDTLALMRSIGADPDRLLLRRPLTLVGPDGRGLRLPPGPPLLAFARAVMARPDWRWRDRLALLKTAAGWWRRGFRCAEGTTVKALTAALPDTVRRSLIDPLCVAALNTPAATADARVFLRVLKDALFSGTGSADLLLPRAPLHELLPGPALRWLESRGAQVRMRHRVMRLAPGGRSWGVVGVDGSAEQVDGVVLACSAWEAARLAEPHAAGWAAQAAGFVHEPIVTVFVESPGARLAEPMVALDEGPQAPAQFAFVVSGAAPWVARGVDACGEAVLQQARLAFPAGTWQTPPRLLQVTAEKRATFACVPGLARPSAHVAPGVAAAGDYIQGPYPATIEGAVRSGRTAVDLLEAEAAKAPDGWFTGRTGARCEIPGCSSSFRDAKLRETPHNRRP